MNFPERPKRGSDTFLSLKKDGDTVVGVFQGGLFTYEAHWVGGKSIVCQGFECNLCKEGEFPGFRFKVNFITKSEENGQMVARIFEQGGRTYDKLKALSEDYNLEQTMVRITRSGLDKATAYSIMPLPPPKGQLTATQIELVKKVKLHPLQGREELPSGHLEPIGESESSDGDIPF